MPLESVILPEPVFLPASRAMWTPGYICGTSPVTVCCGKKLCEESVKYKTLTYQRGCPEPMELCEAAIREFFGWQACKALYRRTKSHARQREILESVLGADLRDIRWGLWEWTPEPVAILKNAGADVLIMFNPTSELSGNVLRVAPEDITEISTYDAWKYLWCGRDINAHIQKECLPESIREDIVRGMYG